MKCLALRIKMYQKLRTFCCRYYNRTWYPWKKNANKKHDLRPFQNLLVFLYLKTKKQMFKGFYFPPTKETNFIYMQKLGDLIITRMNIM